MACIKRFLRPYALAIHHHKFIYNPLAAIVPSNHFSNEIGKRYSHQDIKKIITPTTTVKKKRQVIRKKLTEDTVEKTGFWNVVAVASAEEYDLENVYHAIAKSDKYQPSEFFLETSNTGTPLNFLHAVSKSKFDNETRELFVFREGSVVAWNVSDTEIRNIVDFIKNFEVNRYDKTIVNDEIEVMPYTYAINSTHSLLQNGSICLTQEENKCPLDKYTFSNGMVLSVKLGIWETLLDRYIESLAPLTQDLKLGKPIKITRKDVMRKIGELYSLKHSINLSSDLLDIPDFYWEREELETLYINTCRYFNIPRRTKVINDKLNHCIELVDLLSSHLSDRHHIRLEWMIIVLIMVEVGFEIIHYTQVLS